MLSSSCSGSEFPPPQQLCVVCKGFDETKLNQQADLVGLYTGTPGSKRIRKFLTKESSRTITVIHRQAPSTVSGVFLRSGLVGSQEILQASTITLIIIVIPIICTRNKRQLYSPAAPQTFTTHLPLQYLGGLTSIASGRSPGQKDTVLQDPAPERSPPQKSPRMPLPGFRV